MRKGIAIRLKQLPGLGLQAGVCLLLFLYMAAFLLPQGTVPHVHEEEALHEGDACKKDACHISIYHPGSKAGCQHKFHFTKAPEECLLCHSIITRHLPLQIVHVEEIVCAIPYFSPPDIVGEITAADIYHEDRGPPDFFHI